MTTFPLTARPVPSDLLRQRQAELDELFSLLPAAAPDTVSGHWHGTLMAISGFGWLPRPLARSLYRLLLTPVNPWRGKSFAGTHGANRWLGVQGAAFGHFRVQHASSPVDGKPVLLLDYNVPENPPLLRHIRGEARLLAKDVVLARMNWQGRDALHRVLYFTLTPAD